MTKNERLYIRPDDDLDRQAAIQATVDGFLEFFAEMAEKKGDHEAARKLREKIGQPHPVKPKRSTPAEDQNGQE